MRVLITSGGTKIPIDSVRHIGNMSSGTFGSKIAYEALRAGHYVTFLMASGSKSPLGLRFDEDDSVFKILRKTFGNIIDRIRFRKRIHLVKYADFKSYESWLGKLTYKRPDVVVLAAAVSDYDVVNKVDGKIRTKGDMVIQLTPLPKLISRFDSATSLVIGAIDSIFPQLAPEEGSTYPRPRVLVGFKLLVNSNDVELVAAARESAKSNGCDVVVANDLRDIKANAHRVFLVDTSGSCLLHSKSDDPNHLARAVVEEYTCLFKNKNSKSS